MDEEDIIEINTEDYTGNRQIQNPTEISVSGIGENILGQIIGNQLEVIQRIHNISGGTPGNVTIFIQEYDNSLQ